MQRQALVVGVSQYNNPSLGNFASFTNNANAIADLLEPTFTVTRLPTFVVEGQVRVGNSNILCDPLEQEINKLFSAKDLDTALFYFSGHGLRGKQLVPKTYLAATDSEKLDNGYRKAFEIGDLKTMLANCQAKEQIVWLDCCYGGDLADFAGVCDRNDGKRRFIITASRTQDPAYQAIEKDYGVFTKALMEALARTGTISRRITCAAIEDAVRENLQSSQYPQMPQFYRTTNQTIEFWNREEIAPPESDLEQRIASLKRQRDTLLKSLKNISSQQSLEDIDREVNIIDAQIRNIQQEKSLTDFRKLWEDKLSEIDFDDAKTWIEKIKKDCLSKRDRRYAILLLDNAIAMEGELMFRWLEKYLRDCGTLIEPFVFGFKSTPNKDEFVRELANRYGVSVDADINKIIAKLKSTLCVGGYFLIKIKIPKNDQVSEFLLWFVQDFWQKFTETLNGDSAVVATICIDDEFKDESLNGIFWDSAMDRQKIKRLPLKNWTQDDVLAWLRDHSGLGQRGFSTARFSEVAEISTKGFPSFTRNALTTNLNNLLAETNQMEESA